MMGRQAGHCLQTRGLLRRRVTTTVSLALISSVSPSWSFPFHASRPSSSSSRSVLDRSAPRKLFGGGRNETTGDNSNDDNEGWQPFLPYEDWAHNSARISIPCKNSEHGSIFVKETFLDRLDSTVVGLRELGKSSLWIDVPMSRASLMEDMEHLGFCFHHAHGKNAVLNLWLKESENLVPEYATHHVGVGALVINSRNEILCVRELRKNYMPWKIPGGLSELGEHINEAAEREVYEETGIRAKFCDIVSFRHTHGLANGRSDLYFVCRLVPVEEVDDHGNVVIPEPVPQEGEIEATAWIPYKEFRDMVDGNDGHPMISHILDLHDRGHTIEQRFVSSIVPGRKPSPIYSPKPVTDLD